MFLSQLAKHSVEFVAADRRSLEIVEAGCAVEHPMIVEDEHFVWSQVHLHCPARIVYFFGEGDERPVIVPRYAGFEVERRDRRLIEPDASGLMVAIERNDRSVSCCRK